MRVVRIKHKTGILVACVVLLIILYALILKHSDQEMRLNNINSVPTRTVDFINIGNNAPLETKNEGETEQNSLKNTPLARGKLKSHFRKQPRPPKRRISDGIVDKAVVKSVVRGDPLLGPPRRNSHRQKDDYKTKPIVSNLNEEKGILQLATQICRICYFNLCVTLY